MTTGQHIAYLRVSTSDQSEERQREALAKYNIDKWFSDVASGKNANRPELQKMLEYVREGDVVYVSEFSRLGRNTVDLLQTIDYILDKGARFVSDKENIDTTTPSGRLMMTTLAGLAEFEREMMLERQREGIAIAKREGKYKGKKAKDLKDLERYYAAVQSGAMTKTQAAKELGVCRQTLYTRFAEIEKEQKNG